MLRLARDADVHGTKTDALRHGLAGQGHPPDLQA
jgi:hypothetical protein